MSFKCSVPSGEKLSIFLAKISKTASVEVDAASIEFPSRRKKDKEKSDRNFKVSTRKATSKH